jgi:hypothetical protein
LWLAVSDEHETKPDPMKIVNTPPSIPLSTAEAAPEVRRWC